MYMYINMYDLFLYVCLMCMCFICYNVYLSNFVYYLECSLCTLVFVYNFLYSYISVYVIYLCIFIVCMCYNFVV